MCLYNESILPHRLPLYYEVKILFVLWLVLPITEVSYLCVHLQLYSDNISIRTVMDSNIV